jgi:Fe-S-cluster containining protein
MKCRTGKCGSCCCYNIPFENNELERFAGMIVNKVLFIMPAIDSSRAIVAFTNPDPNKNKCPFLRADFKCNIYENRPEVCRLFGEIEQLPCKYMKR